MAFRTVVVKNRCKLEYSLNYLVCRQTECEKKVLLDEIKLIIIDNTQVSLTSYLISELINRKIKVIFTDACHNPSGEIVPYQNNFYSYKKIKEQINFSDHAKDYLWKKIIEEKITNQYRNLKFLGLEEASEKLMNYKNNVLDGDKSNREGHSAKVYFNALFGKDFSRDSSCDINTFLNYGYSIILSSINREIKSYGYLTELGIHHIGESNSFNLSCDFMEPLRPLVDSYVIKNRVNIDNYKEEFINMLSNNVSYNDKSIFLDNAIHLYVEDMLLFLKTGEESKIRFIKYEL